MKTSLFILLMIIYSSLSSATTDYKIINDNNKSYSKSLKLNKFIFVSYIYEHCFCNLNLLDKLSFSDRKIIIAKLYLNLSRDYPVQLIIPNYEKSNELLVSIRVQPIKKAEYESVILATNYITSKNRLIIKDEEFNDAYATLYYIVNDRLIYYKYLDNTDAENEYIKNNEINNLANHYIYDNNFKNDDQCENLLINYIKNDDLNKTFIARLTLVQYYLLNNNFNKALKVLNETDNIIKKNKYDNWQELYNYTKEEYELTKYLYDNYSK
jgi:hypothetical protein